METNAANDGHESVHSVKTEDSLANTVGEHCVIRYTRPFVIARDETSWFAGGITHRNCGAPAA